MQYIASLVKSQWPKEKKMNFRSQCQVFGMANILRNRRNAHADFGAKCAGYIPARFLIFMKGVSDFMVCDPRGSCCV